MCEQISSTILDLYCIPRPNVQKLERALNAAKEAYELKKSFNEKSKKDLKDIRKSDKDNFSPIVDSNKLKESPPPAKPKSPSTHINTKLVKLAENGSSDNHRDRNGTRRKYHSPRRRYSPVSPHRRKHDRYSRKKKRSSSSSDNSPVTRKRKHRSKRRASSSSEESGSSSDSEVRILASLGFYDFDDSPKISIMILISSLSACEGRSEETKTRRKEENCERQKTQRKDSTDGTRK